MEPTFRASMNGLHTWADREAFGTYSRPAAKAPATASPVSLDTLTAEAAKLWGEGRASFVCVWHPGGDAAYVEVRRSYEDAVTMGPDNAYFPNAVSTNCCHEPIRQCQPSKPWPENTAYD